MLDKYDIEVENPRMSVAILKNKQRMIQDFAETKRSIVYKNTLTLLQHLMIYKWKYDAMTNGDSGVS